MRINYNDSSYCTLTISDGAMISNVVKGFGMPYLEAGARIGMDIVATGVDNPGSDLTVAIRL